MLDLESIRSRWSRLQSSSEDVAALITEVERLRAAIRAMFDAPDLNAEVPARQALLALIGEEDSHGTA